MEEHGANQHIVYQLHVEVDDIVESKRRDSHRNLDQVHYLGRSTP